METTNTRHGKRAAGMVTLTVPMPTALKSELSALASKDERSTAAWVRVQLAALIKRSKAARRSNRHSLSTAS
jgi:predicted transcriptional regulator